MFVRRKKDMRLSLRYILLPVLVISLLASCATSKQLTKKAGVEEGRGNYLDALNLYYEAFQKKQENRSAKKGIKRMAQTILDEYMESAVLAYNSNQIEDAFYHADRADRFLDKVQKMKVELDVPENWVQSYTQIHNAYAKQLYLYAAEELDKRNYGEARESLNILEALNPNYAGLENLKKSVLVAPDYDKAVDFYTGKNYVSAYKSFTSVEESYPGYRDTRTYLNDLIKQHSITLGVLPFTNNSGVENLEAVLQAKIMNGIIQEKSPLMALLNAETLLKRIEEFQADSSSEQVTVVSQLGGNMLLRGEAVSYQFSEKPEVREKKTAYEKETIVRINPFNGARYSEDQFREVSYYDHTFEKTVTVQIRYSLISAVDGTEIYSTTITRSAINQVTYGKYDGDSEKLYPALSGYGDLAKWRRKFSASSDLKSADELILLVLDQIALEVIQGIKTHTIE